MSKSDCTFINRLWPEYSALAEPACDEHDRRYREREGSRLAADLKWIGDAAMLTQRPWLTLFFGFWVVLFGWVLWYDIDKKLGL